MSKVLVIKAHPNTRELTRMIRSSYIESSSLVDRPCDPLMKLRRSVPGRRRLDDNDSQRQPQQAGYRCMPQAWRFLSRLYRRSRSSSGSEQHQESRTTRVSRARHGSHLENRSGKLPRLHPRR